MEDYTEAEEKLIDYFGHRKFAENYGATPVVVYREMANFAFIENMSGPAVDALRRGMKAIYSCNPCRHTDEFDELIKF